MNILSLVILVAGGIMQASSSSIIKHAMIYKASNPDNTMAFYLNMGIAALCSISGFLLYANGLARARLSVAQPVFSTTIFLSIILVSWFFFKESLSLYQFIGMAVIITGIVMIVR